MPDVEPGSALRASVCPRCEYSLLGHPPGAICPECGATFDADAIYLYGYALGGLARWYNTTPPKIWQLTWATVGAIAVLLFLPVGRFNSVFLFLWIIMLVGFGLWRRYAHHGSALIQVTLAPQGFRQGNRQLGPVP